MSPLHRTACALAVSSIVATATIDSQTVRTTDESAPRAAGAPIRAGRTVDFIANRGQWDARIKFIARHGALTAAVEHDALALRIGANQSANLSLTFEHA